MPEKNYSADQILINEQDEVQHILGHPPGWILRWGISIIFVLVAIFILLSWIIKYPDIIPARVLILGEQPAIRVVAPADGKLTRLQVADKQMVDSGAVLAVIDNSASWEDIQRLKLEMEKVTDIKSAQGWLLYNPQRQLNIGTLQYAYAAFLQRLRDFQYFLRKDDVQARVESLKQQMSRLEELYGKLENQKETFREEMKLAEKNVKRNIELDKEGLISDKELEDSQGEVLDYKRRQENHETQQLDTKIRIDQIRTQIIEIEQGRTDGKSERELGVRNEVQRLFGEIKDWEQRFLLQAPIAGQVSMTNIWSAQQFVRTNEEVFTIVPESGRGGIIGKAMLPVSNSGKVKKGMRVNIRLDSYPYQEFGVVKASVNNSSLIPEESNYVLEINIPDTLRTTYNFDIPFRQEMEGTAHIITEDRRVISRVFDRIWSILKNS